MHFTHHLMVLVPVSKSDYHDITPLAINVRHQRYFQCNLHTNQMPASISMTESLPLSIEPTDHTGMASMFNARTVTN
jgi:hypothetical protein